MWSQCWSCHEGGTAAAELAVARLPALACWPPAELHSLCRGPTGLLIPLASVCAQIGTSLGIQELLPPD